MGGQGVAATVDVYGWEELGGDYLRVCLRITFLSLSPPTTRAARRYIYFPVLASVGSLSQAGALCFL